MAHHFPLLILLATFFTWKCFATDPGFRIAITNKGLDCGELLNYALKSLRLVTP